MIKVTIRKAAESRGVKNAYSLQLLAGLSPAVAADLWKGEKLPKLPTLDRLCRVLKCRLDELIQWKPDTVRNGHAKAGRVKSLKKT